LYGGGSGGVGNFGTNAAGAFNAGAGILVLTYSPIVPAPLQSFSSQMGGLIRRSPIIAY
jgi:hypothetical protein